MMMQMKQQVKNNIIEMKFVLTFDPYSWEWNDMIRIT
jgi:hypothetical protein